MKFTLTLPLPPSTNNLFVDGGKGRRVLSPAYKAWREEAGWTLLAQKPPKLTGKGCGYYYPVSVSLTLTNGKGLNGRRDADNFFKPVLDLLVTQQVLDGDSLFHIDRLNFTFLDGQTGCPAALTVTIETAEVSP